MSKTDNANKVEVWQRGPVANIPTLLQPVAHALLQAREEVGEIIKDFPDSHLWQKPATVASVGFHLQHLAGVLDRLFTYAKGDALDEEQLANLLAEGHSAVFKSNVMRLVELFNTQVDEALKQLGATDEKTLAEQRFVGRAKIPATVIGILFHSAEHTMRHVGQLYVTVKIINEGLKKGL